MIDPQEFMRLFSKMVENAWHAMHYPALLGDGAGKLYPDITRPNTVYARLVQPDGTITPTQIQVKKTRIVNDAPVLVMRNRSGKLEAVEGDPDQAQFWEGVGSPNVGNHAQSHTRFMDDPLLIESLMFLPLLTYPTFPKSLSVNLAAYFYEDKNGFLHYWGGAAVDLTSYVPVNTNETRIAIVGLDTKTAQAQVVLSAVQDFSPFTSSNPFTSADVAAIDLPINFIPSAAVWLYNGQSEINLTDIFFDLRNTAGYGQSALNIGYDYYDPYQRGKVNFVAGEGVTITFSDDPNNDTLNLILSASNDQSGALTDKQGVIYVDKTGNDSNSGLNINSPKLTIGAAITAASNSATNGTGSAPSGTNRIKVEILDSGRYIESLTTASYIDLHGPTATLVGQINLADYVSVKLLRQSHSGDGVIGIYKNSGSSSSTVDIERIEISTTTANASYAIGNRQSGSILIAHCRQLIVNEDCVGAGDLTGGGGHVHLELDDLYLAGDNAIGIGANTANENIIGAIHHILETNSPSSTTAISVGANGTCYLTCSEIIADTAYTVTANGFLSLNCTQIQGTRTGARTDVVTTAVGSHAYQFIPFVQEPSSTPAVDGWANISYDETYFTDSVRYTSNNDLESIYYTVSLGVGTWEIDVMGGTDSFFGKIDISYNTTAIGTWDQYSASLVTNAKYNTTFTVTEEQNYGRLFFRINGKNASSTGYYGVITGVSLMRVG